MGEEEGRGRAPGWAATIRRSARGNTHDQFGAVVVSLRLACSRSITRACGCECDRHSLAARRAARPDTADTIECVHGSVYGASDRVRLGAPEVLRV